MSEIETMGSDEQITVTPEFVQNTLSYIDGMEAHLDEGGKISSGNVRDLIGYLRESAKGYREHAAILKVVIADRERIRAERNSEASFRAAFSRHGVIMTTSQGAPEAGAWKRTREKFELWFFRDILDEHRLALFRLFGMPVGEIKSLGEQRHCIKPLLDALAASPSPPPGVGATDADPECTDCGGTGVTYQTERRCSCQPALVPSPSLLKEAEEALRELRLTAALLHQNAVGCATNHYGHDHELLGLPGWLADCQKDIDAAQSVLARLGAAS